jgi:ATP-binding cassette subfamily F protein 3
MSGNLLVNAGEFHRHPNLKVAHIAQHHIEQLGEYLDLTPVDYFMQQHHAKNEQEARQFLGGFGLVGPLALQKIGTLSGGQKARLAFSAVMVNEPHLLILE